MTNPTLTLPIETKLTPDQIVVGELYFFDRRVIQITSKVPEDAAMGFLSKLRGKALFTYWNLTTETDREFEIYDKQFEGEYPHLIPATDEHLIEELARASAHYPLTETLNMWLPNYEGAGICLSRSDEEDSRISLSYEEAQLLKDKLNQFLE